jgi:hypothetical protein
MTRIEDRADDELLYDLGGREHPSVFFLDAGGEVLARPEADDTSVKALEETGAKVGRSLELRKKVLGGDEASRVDLLIVQCDLGVIEFPDLESEIGDRKLSAEQERAVGTLRADATVADMEAVLRKNRDQAARDLVAEEFVALYRKGAHPGRVSSRRFYWPVIAGQAVAAKDPAMLRDAIAGMKAVHGAETPPRVAEHIAGLEATLRELEAAK